MTQPHPHCPAARRRRRRRRHRRGFCCCCCCCCNQIVRILVLAVACGGGDKPLIACPLRCDRSRHPRHYQRGPRHPRCCRLLHQVCTLDFCASAGGGSPSTPPCSVPSPWAAGTAVAAMEVEVVASVARAIERSAMAWGRVNWPAQHTQTEQRPPPMARSSCAHVKRRCKNQHVHTSVRPHTGRQAGRQVWVLCVR